MVTFKAKVNPKVLTATTKKWVSSGSGSQGSSFKVSTPPKTTASSGPAKATTASSKGIPASSFLTKDRLLAQKIARDTLVAAPIPTKTIVFKTATPPAKVKKPGIWSPVVFKPTPYVASTPKVKVGTIAKPKKSSSSDSGSSGGGPKIGTFHPDSANKAMMAPGGGKLRSKKIGTGGKTTY
jgi:hypothetical protein